jgi:hypothetical protein
MSPHSAQEPLAVSRKSGRPLEKQLSHGLEIVLPSRPPEQADEVVVPRTESQVERRPIYDEVERAALGLRATERASRAGSGTMKICEGEIRHRLNYGMRRGRTDLRP